jgi:hypothetical protein
VNTRNVVTLSDPLAGFSALPSVFSSPRHVSVLLNAVT